MGTIFDQEELKYTQIDIDVRDAKIEELQRKLEEMEKKLNYERIYVKMMANYSYGSQVYIDDEYKNMRTNTYQN